MSNIIQRTIDEEVKDNKLNYAFSINLFRAFPNVLDGFKVVSRRIMLASDELKLEPNSPHQKSVLLVGRSMVYHNHGDASIYDAITKLTQNFYVTVPMLDGHGSWGTASGESAASSRYTEIRLSKYGKECIEDLHKNSVNWVEATITGKEPTTLPVKYPNLLINGSYGIGQGYNSFVPTHNFNEVIDLTIDLIKNPNIEMEELVNRIAPDFPLGGIITNREELKEVYRTGYGKCKVRGEIVRDENKNTLTIKSFAPIKTNLNSIKEIISEKIKLGIITGISEIKDLTKKNDINLVIKAKKGYPLDKLENMLYKETPLETTLPLSFMCTEDENSFRYYNIKEILTKWIDYRRLTIKRILNYDMSAIRKRLHIIDALLKSLIDIDTIISTIKKSENKKDAIDKLMAMKKYEFDILQAKYIVEMQLSSLSKIGRTSLEEEKDKLEKELDKLIELFTNQTKLDKYIIKELEDGKKKYGRERKTQLTDIDTEEVIYSDEDYTFFLTKQGMCKKMQLELNVQSSGGKGRKCGKLRNDDYIIKAINVNNLDSLLFFTNKGLVYTIKAHDIPIVALNTLGTKIYDLVKMKYEDEYIINVINISNSDFDKDDNLLIFTTEKGLIKSTRLNQYSKSVRSSLIAIKLREDDSLQDVMLAKPQDHILLCTNTGKYTRYEVSEIPESLRMSLGVQSMSGIQQNERIISSTIIKGKDYIFVIDSEGKSKKINEEEVSCLSRNNKAKLIAKTDGHIIKVAEMDETDEVMIVTKKKIIKLSAKDIRQSIRTSKGKECISLEEDDSVLDIAINEEVNEEE